MTEDTRAPACAPAAAAGQPTNEDFERLWETTHYGHPADFAADVLERWGGWPAGVLGYGGSGTAQGMAQDAARMRKALDQAIDALDALTDKVDRTGFADSDAFAEALDAIDIGRAALRAVPHQPTGARE